VLELKVACHPSGRRTLEEREEGQQGFRNPPISPLFANSNAAAFYRAIAARLGALAKDGRQFSYRDIDSDPESN
jgi:hypothetical protein